MGHQLYCIAFKKEVVVGYTKDKRPKTKIEKDYRAPRPEDEIEISVAERLAAKMPEWQGRNIVPDEEFPSDTNDDRPLQYGAPLWRDQFNPRQLFGHCTSVEVFQDLVEELKRRNNGQLSDLDRAAMVYVALALDKLLNYNAIQVRWHSSRGVMAGVFDRHDFSFKWSYAEMAPAVTGFGYNWAFEQTAKALSELIELLGYPSDVSKNGSLFQAPSVPQPETQILCGSADALAIEPESVDCIVMDPPYYDNVMYAELSDFFYVWLKRTAGFLYPEIFVAHLTDKDREAVANPAKFAGQKGARKLARSGLSASHGTNFRRDATGTQVRRNHDHNVHA